MFFRVTVMLSCLILVPLAAIFGSAFPELVRTHLVDRIKTVTGFTRNPSSTLAEKAQSPGLPTVSTASWESTEPAPAWQPAADPSVHQVDYSAPEVSAPANVAVQELLPSEDHFTRIQQRLREFGATYYALESLEDGNGYRFRCAMGIAGSPSVEQFEANDRDPLQAMATVMSQVEAWRSGGRNNGAQLH
jgi:hypothetical protein